MTRPRIVVAGAGAVAALGVFVAVVASCGSSCKPGTLAMRLGLVNGAQAADTFIISGDDPGAVVSDSFAHVPNLVYEKDEWFDVAVTWPAGYPVYAVVHLTVRAYAAGQLIAYNTETIRLSESCTSGEMLLGTQSLPDDGGATD